MRRLLGICAIVAAGFFLASWEVHAQFTIIHVGGPPTPTPPAQQQQPAGQPPAQQQQQQQAAQQPAPPQQNPPAQDPPAAVAQDRAQMQQAYGTINANNPVSDSYGSPPNTLNMTPEMARNLENAQKLMANPVFQKYLKVISNPEFSKSLLELVNHPNRGLLFQAEIVLLLGIMFFRARKSAKAEGAMQRMWISIYTSAFWLIVGGVALPYLLIGPSYMVVLSSFVGFFTA